jgi:uncharacterized metal-binding protein YceD (DUF177 family)
VRSNLQFIIPFKGLKVGRHDFIFDIDKTFFAGFEESEIEKGDVHVIVNLNKRVNMLEFDFKLSGHVWVICDRCLEEFSMPIEYETKLFAKFGENSEEQTDEIILLSYSEHEIDLSQYIYEYIYLSLPYRKVHPDDKSGKSTCNQEMISKLDTYIIRESEQNTDPRWDNLKDFLLNNN